MAEGVIDDYGRTAYLSVTPGHRADCTFGPGLYRLTYGGTSRRYAQTEAEVHQVEMLLRGVVRDILVERDGYCLDGDRVGDANTPDVVDGDWWLGLSQADGMRELGLEREADYRRVYAQVESAVYRRDNRQSQGGVHASIVLKRRGAKVIDAR